MFIKFNCWFFMPSDERHLVLFWPIEAVLMHLVSWLAMMLGDLCYRTLKLSILFENSSKDSSPAKLVGLF